MIDTIEIRIANNGKIDVDRLKYTENYDIRKNKKKRIDKSVAYYTYKNFLIELPININDPKLIKINGSIQKLVNSQNVVPNSILKIKEEIKVFSEAINIDLFSQPVFRVDVCNDYQIDSVWKILKNIYSTENYYKNEYNNTLYFDKWKNKNYFKTCFYDKGKEIKQPKKNIIRHEIRLYKARLNNKAIYTLNDVFNRLDDLELIRRENMTDFKAIERKPVNLTGNKRDLILRAREIGINKIMFQIKNEYPEGHILTEKKSLMTI